MDFFHIHFRQVICQLSHKDNFRGKLFAGFCEGSHMDIEGNAVIDASCWARKDISRYGFVSSQRLDDAYTETGIVWL